MAIAFTHDRFDCVAVEPVRSSSSLEADARAGLLCTPRWLPPKYFYDDLGSRLFEEICATPEYYPSRTEDALLETHAREILELVRPLHILEFGSGSSRKTRHLLQAAAHHGMDTGYWPFDICESMVRTAGVELAREYSWLTVQGLVGDYLCGLDHLPHPGDSCLFVFLGGTIGNFEPDEALRFLKEVRARSGPGDALLLGADRAKDADVLHAAYNDSAGVTAQFNLNVLNVLNDGLGSNFRPDRFSHEARYIETRQQIEMYLVANTDQRVDLGSLGTQIDIERGERIRTEISRKFHGSELEQLLGTAGFAVERHFEPGNGWFSLLLARPATA